MINAPQNDIKKRRKKKLRKNKIDSELLLDVGDKWDKARDFPLKDSLLPSDRL